MLKEQRQEYERLSAEATELATQLAQALTDRDQSARHATDLELDVSRLSTDNTILNQQLSDLGRQVRALARAIAAKENPALGDPNDGDEEEEAIRRRADELADTDSVVSAHLVTFANVNELQVQNQKLLQITRQMGQQLEEGEQEAIARRAGEENRAVEEAHELILKLKEEIENQRTRTEAYEKERDMFRRMLAQRGSGGQAPTSAEGGALTSTGDLDAARMLADVQAAFDAYKSEMMVDSQRLRDDLSQAQRDVASARTELAKSKAQAEFMTGTLRLSGLCLCGPADVSSMCDCHRALPPLVRVVRDAADGDKPGVEARARSPGNSGSARHGGTQGISRRLQSALDIAHEVRVQMSEEQLELRSAVSQLRHENNNLKSERDVLKSVEQRLGEENATLSRERTHLADLMRNLQTMQNELERSGNDARRRLEETVVRLEART